MTACVTSRPSPFPTGHHLDPDGELRLIVRYLDWDGCIRLAFDEIRLASRGSLGADVAPNGSFSAQRDATAPGETTRSGGTAGPRFSQILCRCDKFPL